MGAERALADWHDIVRYLHVLDAGSDRLVVEELGPTTMGNPYLLVTVSTPETIRDLPRHRAQQRRLADPRTTGPVEAAHIAREGKAVLLMTASVHSNEIGASQMASELLYKLATEESRWVEHVLENVIVLVVPCQNPDGLQMIVDWYEETLDTPHQGSPLPWLYHKYVGHDNNRDNYMNTQVETRHLTRLTYRDWLPEVYLDQHQMGSRGPRIFVPPFKNPPNPNVDPLIWSEVNLLGQTMAAHLQADGKTGVIWGEQYSGFWQGANSTSPWWHNMVALLTEVASSHLATTIVQEVAEPEDRLHPSLRPPRVGGLTGEPGAYPALPAPTDTQYRMNYPQPWLGGPWSLADVVDYQLGAALGLLEGVANNREMLKRNFYQMNRQAIERFAAGDPYAFIVPSDQRDRVAAAKLLQLLQAGGAEVHRIDEPVEVDGRTYAAGTHVVLLAQPFGRWVKDLLEPQEYPDIRWPVPSAPIDRPYDVTAWSLGMLMGVETTLVNRPFEASLTLLAEDVEATPGGVSSASTGSVYVLSHDANNAFIAMNRLLAAGARVSWAQDPLEVNDQHYESGAIVVTGVERSRMDSLARELALDVEATPARPTDRLLELRPPRIAVYEPWGGNMDAGWTRWLLEQYEFPFVHARNADIKAPALGQRFDVIIVPEMSSNRIVRGNMGRNVRPEYRGGIGPDGVRNLRDFVRDGGTVITLGNAADFAVEWLGIPFENTVRGLSADAFFCPGSIVRIAVDTQHPIGYGMPEEADAMFVRNGALRPTGAFPSKPFKVVARYPSGDLLRSGWIIGQSRLRGAAATLEAGLGEGRVITHAFRVQNRAQTWGTFRLLFNSVFYGAMTSGAPIGTTEAAQVQQ